MDVGEYTRQLIMAYLEEFDFNPQEIDAGIRDLMTDELLETITEHLDYYGALDYGKLFELLDLRIVNHCPWGWLKDLLIMELDDAMAEQQKALSDENDNEMIIGLSELELHADLSDSDWDELTGFVSALRQRDFNGMLKSVPRWQENACELGWQLMNQKG